VRIVLLVRLRQSRLQLRSGRSVVGLALFCLQKQIARNVLVPEVGLGSLSAKIAETGKLRVSPCELSLCGVSDFSTLLRELMFRMSPHGLFSTCCCFVVVCSVLSGLAGFAEAELSTS
jgi:hypothetical protein